MPDIVVGGNTLRNWAAFVLIVLVAILVMKLVSLLSRKAIKPLTKRTDTRLDDIVYNSLESPILFGIMLLGFWIALHRLSYPDKITDVIDKSYRILVVLNITWIFARLSGSLLETYWANRSETTRRGRKFSVKMMPVVRRTLLVVVWAVGIVTALSNVGVDITALLGTLGIGGIAFALAAQDTIKNIFGGFTILADRPFSIGDVVRIDSHEGTIIDVGVRTTKMRNSDKRIITFPNYKIADASVLNISAEPMRRVVMKLGLTYDTTPEKMRLAMDLLREMPSKVEFVSPKDVVVNFSEFADSALVITFIYFIEKKGDKAQTISAVNMEILTSFNEAGLNFAFPTQTVYVEKTV